ncbi:unnamed protein product [Thlaspi arvense]|uniref:Uncharacterized protein n=1 Tax=Thlaspi arvense TaxID=13288 RepID=A0AAU9RWH1_THLAR|nr:unnamed protein product [Thlaspi arvense]
MKTKTSILIIHSPYPWVRGVTMVPHRNCRIKIQKPVA